MIDYTTLMMFVIISAVGLLGLAALESISMLQQQAEAAKSTKGECASTLKNASAQFCHRLP
jgi:hypothetical protein